MPKKKFTDLQLKQLLRQGLTCTEIPLAWGPNLSGGPKVRPAYPARASLDLFNLAQRRRPTAVRLPLWMITGGLAKSTVSERLEALKIAVSKDVTLRSAGEVVRKELDTIGQLQEGMQTRYTGRQRVSIASSGGDGKCLTRCKRRDHP